MTDSEFARSSSVNSGNGNDNMQATVKKTECLSIDYIQKVQQNSKTNF